jgi:hypothetical protein
MSRGISILLLLVTALLLCGRSSAQAGNIDLMAQSADGRTVKLLWYVKTWDSNYKGFDIKRSEGLGQWQQLNKAPVLPGISQAKDISIVEPDKVEETRIRAKMFRMIRSGQLKECATDSMLQLLAGNEKALRTVENALSKDYDLALLNGFAFVDHSVTLKTGYVYGIFIAGTGTLLDTATWNYGQVPDMNVVEDITSRASVNAKGIEVIWNADRSKMNHNNVAGFNIYREGIRLNNEPVNTPSKDGEGYSWNDRTAGAKEPVSYAISAESIFGIEGMITPYTYNPADHPASYRTATVKEIGSLGYYFKDGISVKWEFPKEYEKFIKGFYVEKNNLPDGYKQVSQLLEPTARAFIDKTASPVSGYITFRIVAVYKDRSRVPCHEMMYNYFPSTAPPAPQRLQASLGMDMGQANVILAWDEPMAGDTVTDHYRVYLYNAVNDAFSTVADVRRNDHRYVYAVPHNASWPLRFFVSSASEAGVESILSSDTLSVATAAIELPAPVITSSSVVGMKLAIHWQYPQVGGLKGFRVYDKDSLIASEAQLPAGSEQYLTEEMAPGEHSFTMVAVSERGTTGSASTPVNIVMAAADKH